MVGGDTSHGGKKVPQKITVPAAMWG